MRNDTKTPRGAARWSPCLLALTLAACGARDVPPGNADVRSALRDAVDHVNDRGGLHINLGSAGGFKDLHFDIRVHGVIVHSCKGQQRVYVCDIEYRASFPPVKDEQEWVPTTVTLFDGPGGWRVIE
ncbi:hypothetical protein [Lysobacter tyrosinilyticus]